MIDGVRTKQLRMIPDERGRLTELLRCDDDLNHPGVPRRGRVRQQRQRRILLARLAQLLHPRLHLVRLHDQHRAVNHALRERIALARQEPIGVATAEIQHFRQEIRWRLPRIFIPLVSLRWSP